LLKIHGILRLPAGRQGLLPQDDKMEVVILNEVKNPTQCSNSCIMLKAEGSFACLPVGRGFSLRMTKMGAVILSVSEESHPQQ